MAEQPTVPPTNQPAPVEPEVSKDDGSLPARREVGVGLAVGVAVAIALLLVLIGILAYKNSNTSTDVDEDSKDTTEVQDQDTQTEVSDIEALTEDISTLDDMEEELDGTEISDEALGID